MSKSETLKQLAAASNREHLAALQRQIELLHRAQTSSAEELAALLEPLAQAMATLTEETAKIMLHVEQSLIRQHMQLTHQVQETSKNLERIEAAARTSSAHLVNAASSLGWHHYLHAIMSGVLAALLTIAFWRWLGPSSIAVSVDSKAIAAEIKQDLRQEFIQTMRGESRPRRK